MPPLHPKHQNEFYHRGPVFRGALARMPPVGREFRGFEAFKVRWLGGVQPWMLGGASFSVFP